MIESNWLSTDILVEDIIVYSTGKQFCACVNTSGGALLHSIEPC